VPTNRSHAKRGMCRASEAGLLTYRSLRAGSLPVDSGWWVPRARCLQWRDRAGFAPASLFTRRF